MIRYIGYRNQLWIDFGSSDPILILVLHLIYQFYIDFMTSIIQFCVRFVSDIFRTDIGVIWFCMDSKTFLYSIHSSISHNYCSRWFTILYFATTFSPLSFERNEIVCFIKHTYIYIYPYNKTCRSGKKCYTKYQLCCIY